MPAVKRQAAKKTAAGKTAHPVRPAKGPVDMKALREELISKFPKTLARLAK